MPKPWLQPIERALLNAAQVADGEEVPQELAHALLDLEQRVEAGLLELRAARAALAQNATFPADVALARNAIDQALARFQEI